MTENENPDHGDQETRASESAATLGEMSHTNPFTDESFGSTQTYQRGQMVAADGGKAESTRDGTDETTDEDEVLRDVEHTPPEGAESANRVHQRGGEATEDEV